MRKSLISLVVIVFFLLCSKTLYSATLTDGYFFYSDSNSTATGKSGLESGVTATSDNFTNNTKGITGVKLNFSLSAGETLNSLGLGDFDFHFGNTDIVDSWNQLSLSNPSLSINSNEAFISWDTPIVKNGWLELKYSTDQYLYFGNLVGDASLDGFLTPYDALEVIDHINNNSQVYSYQYDINCDGNNSPPDALIIINLLNSGGSGTSIADGPFVRTSGTSSPIRIQDDPDLFPYQNITLDLIYLNETYELVARPIPEPATMLLLSSGLIGLAGFRRKFKK